MSDDTSLPTGSRERSPTRHTFWEKYGWNTTYSLCVGIGAFGILQFLIGLVCLPTYPALDLLEVLVLFGTAPLLAIAGITGFSLPIYSLIRHHWFDDRDRRLP